MRATVIALSLIGMALLTAQALRREDPTTAIEIVDATDDEQWRINMCITGKGWAVFKMPEPPTPETERWPAQYIGCNVRFLE